jgi:hypothetical protein
MSSRPGLGSRTPPQARTIMTVFSILLAEGAHSSLEWTSESGGHGASYSSFCRFVPSYQHPYRALFVVVPSPPVTGVHAHSSSPQPTHTDLIRNVFLYLLVVFSLRVSSVLQL